MGSQKSLDDRSGDLYGDRLLSGCRDPTHSRKLERPRAQRNEGNNACKRNGARGVKKWRVDEFGHCGAQNYQNMKKGTSVTPV